MVKFKSILLALIIGTLLISCNGNLPETLFVSYDPNGATIGEAPIDSNTYEIGAVATILDNSGNLAVDGYSFNSWNSVADGSGERYLPGDEILVDTNVYLFAQWTAIPTYTILYNANDADSGTIPSEQIKTQGLDIVLATNSGNLDREGFSFVGWNTKADGSGISFSVGSNYTVDADLELFADWTALPTFTISYNENNADSGDAPPNQIKVQGIDIELATNTGSLEREGYTFIGWNSNSEGTGISYSMGADYAENEDIELFAHWTALPTYTISYDANNADDGEAPSNQIKIQEIDIKLASNDGGLTREGYTFVGWNTQSDGFGQSYIEGTNYTVDAELELYAEWTALPTYTISYDANNADDGEAPSNQTKIQGIDIELASNDGALIREGYNFVGWSTASDGVGINYSVGTLYSDDAALSLYAKWELIPLEGIDLLEFSEEIVERPGIELIQSSTILVQDKFHLTVQSIPQNALLPDLIWSSNDTNIATVDQNTGEVTAIAAGEVEITVRSFDSSFIDVTTLEVSPTTILVVEITQEDINSESFGRVDPLNYIGRFFSTGEENGNTFVVANDNMRYSYPPGVNTGSSTNYFFFDEPGTFSIRIGGHPYRLADIDGADNLEDYLVDIQDWGEAAISNEFFASSQKLQDYSASSPIDLSQVTTFASMFDSARGSFENTDFSTLNTVGFTNFNSIFRLAYEFNGNIQNFNTSQVTDMSNAFSSASSFNRDISGWDVSKVTTMENMFHGVTLSTANYDAILIGWEAQNVQDNVNFHGGFSQYSSGAAAAARQRLIDEHGWIITDGGLAP